MYCGNRARLEKGLPMQAYPNKQDLVKAIKGRLKSASGKKKLSKLKRLILREKTDKAAEAAVASVAAAVAAASKAEAAHASVSQGLQVGPLDQNGNGTSRPCAGRVVG